MRKLLVKFVQFSSLSFLLCKLILSLVQFLVELGKLVCVALVESLDVLHLLTSVRKHDDGVDDLASQTGQLLVSLFDLLVESLIFDLELLVIDQVKTFSQLFLLLQNTLLILKSVSQSNVLKTVLMDFLIFGFVGFLPILDDLSAELLTSTAVYSVHSNGSLEFLELLLDLSALRLFLVKLVLQLTSHSVVPILSFFQVIANLMDISKSV